MTFMFLMVILGSTDERTVKSVAPVPIDLALTLFNLISIPVTNTSVQGKHPA
jgi:aquaporin Z